MQHAVYHICLHTITHKSFPLQSWQQFSNLEISRLREKWDYLDQHHATICPISSQTGIILFQILEMQIKPTQTEVKHPQHKSEWKMQCTSNSTINDKGSIRNSIYLLGEEIKCTKMRAQTKSKYCCRRYTWFWITYSQKKSSFIKWI